MKNIMPHTFRSIPLILIASGAIIIITTSAVPIQQTIGVASIPPEIRYDIRTEFINDDNTIAEYDKTNNLYHRTINCYFNMAAQKIMGHANEQFVKDVQHQIEPTVATPEDDALKCDFLESETGMAIAKEYHDILQDLLEKSYTTDQQAAAPPTQEEIDQVKTCDLDITARNPWPDDEWKVGMVDANTSYFDLESRDLQSPVYAAYLVSSCYKIVYDEYLERWTDAPLRSTDPNPETRTTESLGRQSEVDLERKKSLDAIELTALNLQEMQETFPLHTRYDAIIQYSEKTRDNMSRIRATMNQLPYKLINLSSQGD